MTIIKSRGKVTHPATLLLPTCSLGLLLQFLAASPPSAAAAPAIEAVGATLTAESFTPANGTIDIGETATIILRLRNSGDHATTNLVATLLATNGVVPVPPNNPQAYLVISPGGFPVGRPFSFTANGTNGGTISPTLQLQDGTGTYPPVSFTFSLPFTQTFINTNPITIPDPAAGPPYLLDAGPASPYPSVISVSNLVGVLGNVSVTLSNLSHGYVADVNALLVAPNGASVLVMSHAGDQSAATNVNLTFDDAAPAPLPGLGSLVSGVYQPSAYSTAPAFPPDAPGGPYSGALSSLNARNPNGNWSLYVLDDAEGDSGLIANGWSLTFTMITPINHLAELKLIGSASPLTNLVGTSLSYTFSVTNAGPAPASAVSFVSSLPTGVLLISASASQGDVLTNPASVAAYLGTVNVGAVATVSVVVATTAAAVPAGATEAWLTNAASVTASELDPNPGNNSVAVASRVKLNPPPASGPANFTAVDLLPGQSVQLTATGTLGACYYIEATTNAVATNWTGLRCVTNTSGTFQYSDPGTNLPWRFYRTRLGP